MKRIISHKAAPIIVLIFFGAINVAINIGTCDLMKYFLENLSVLDKIGYNKVIIISNVVCSISGVLVGTSVYYYLIYLFFPVYYRSIRMQCKRYFKKKQIKETPLDNFETL